MTDLMMVDDDKSGFDVVTALRKSNDSIYCGSFAEAWRALDEGEDPYVVLLDLHLEEDGMKLLKHPRLQTGKIRTIILTCDARAVYDENIAQLLHAGADAVLLKPVTLGVLEAYIARAIHTAKQVRARTKPDTGSFPRVTLEQALVTRGIL